MPYDIGHEEPGFGARRLLLLADYIEKQPAESYYQPFWRISRPNCGTTCCAFGHAVTGLGQALGVRWESADLDDERICRLDGSFPIQGKPERMRSNMLLAQEVFELTWEETIELFGDDGEYYPATPDLTPQIVAKGLRKFATAKLENINAV